MIAGIKYYVQDQNKENQEFTIYNQEVFDMISSSNSKDLIIEGNIREVSAECIIIMREIYKKSKQIYGKEVAVGILTTMLIKAIDENVKRDNAEWKISDQEKFAYTE